MGGFQKILEKYHMEKWFRKDNLVLMVLAGILLVVIALPTKENEEESASGVYGTIAGNGYQETQTGQETETAVAGSENQGEDYLSGLEKKLAKLLSKIEGAGEVYVMITLQESEELVVEKDRMAEEEATVYESEGNASVPYVIKTIYPKVEGVVVIAEGAGSGRVTQHITEAVQALFGLEAHKVKVTGS